MTNELSLKIMNKACTEAGKKTLPKQFSEEVRPDLIKKAVLVIQNANRQPYGAESNAGMKASAELSRRRRKYRGSYGHGISRVPRKILSRRGTRMNWVGAVAPGTVGGRRAHPPKAEKVFSQKINQKERRKAIRSAISATVVSDVVSERGHKVPEAYPFIIESGFEQVSKTKDIIDSLINLGFKEELTRSDNKHVRAGKGKARGRKYRNPKGILIVVSKKCKLIEAAGNIPGADCVVVDKLNTELLAPGSVPGRLALFTEDAVERIEKELLFTDNPKTKETKKPKEKKTKEKKTKEKKTKEKKAVEKKAPETKKSE